MGRVGCWPASHGPLQPLCNAGHVRLRRGLKQHRNTSVLAHAQQTTASSLVPGMTKGALQKMPKVCMPRPCVSWLWPLTCCRARTSSYLAHQAHCLFVDRDVLAENMYIIWGDGGWLRVSGQKLSLWQAELEEEMRQLSLDTRGTKPVLVDRLHAYLLAQEVSMHTLHVAYCA